MKTTWNIIHKEISNPTNENNIKSLKIKNHIVQNQRSIANEFNNYFLNTAGVKVHPCTGTEALYRPYGP